MVSNQGCFFHALYKNVEFGTKSVKENEDVI